MLATSSAERSTVAEIEITLPTVQYGNVKVRATPEELGIEDLTDASSVGIAAAVYLNLFTQGFKAGAQMELSADLAASQDADMVKAHDLLDEGLGGVTEVAEDVPPWGKPAVDVRPKPWETEVTAPAVLDAVGDGW